MILPLLLQLHHLLPINSPTTTISIMNHLNRKLLQQQQDPFHPILPHTLLHPINDSPPTSTSTSVAAAPRPFNPTASPFDTSMALTILVLLTALFFMTFFSFYICRFSGGDIDSSNSHHRRGSSSSSTSATTAVTHRGSRATTKGLDPEIIKSLPTFPYGGDTKYRLDCSICLSEFEEGETVKLIDYCRHGFHPGCIDTWLASHVSCPLCRSTRLFGGAGGGVGLGAVEDNVSCVPATSSTADDVGSGGGDVVVGTGFLRRTCSYSSLVGGGSRGCLSLPRSNSF